MKQLITVITSYRYHQPERCGDSMLVIPGGYEPEEYHEEFIDILEPECVEFDDSAYVGTKDLCLCVGISDARIVRTPICLKNGRKRR